MFYVRVLLMTFSLVIESDAFEVAEVNRVISDALAVLLRLDGDS